METVNQNNEVIWFDPDLISSDIVTQAFDINYWKSKNKVIGKAQGRGTTWFIKTESIDVALRHYFRGGLIGKYIADSFLFTSWKKTRCFQEISILSVLVKNNVNVPKPVAAKASRKGLFYRSDIMVEKINNSIDLCHLLTQQEVSTEIYKNIGLEIKKMHQAGVNHTDLNIHNILIDNNAKVWIIDFDKCSISPGHKWKSGNIARLYRSFKKELTNKNIHFQESNWEYLLKAYSN